LASLVIHLREGRQKKECPRLGVGLKRRLRGVNTGENKGDGGGKEAGRVPPLASKEVLHKKDNDLEEEGEVSNGNYVRAGPNPSAIQKGGEYAS